MVSQMRRDLLSGIGAGISLSLFGGVVNAASDDVIRAQEGSNDHAFDDLLRDKSLQGGFIWDWVNRT